MDQPADIKEIQNSTKRDVATSPIVPQCDRGKDIATVRRVRRKCTVTNPVVPPSNADLSGWETMAKRC